jgi:DNA-binding protein H-NS
MMTDEELRRKIDALPEPVVDHLYSEHIGDLNGQIIERNQLTQAQKAVLFALLREVFAKEVPFGSLADEIKKRFAFDDAKAKKLATDIAGYRLLPLDKWIGDVAGYLRRMGANPASYPAERVQVVQRTREEAVDEIVNADDAAASAADRIKTRIREIVSSFLAGVRTEAQTIEILTRSDKVGGAGLTEEAAYRLLAEAKEETRTVVIRGKAVGLPEPPAAPAALSSSPDSELTAAPAFPPPPVQPKTDFRTIRPEDDEEIAHVKQAVLPAKGAAVAEETSRDIEASIQALYLSSGLKTDDEAMEKRIKTVIGNRLRDVRDEMETLETLVQPKELGGLGLRQDSARALLNAIRSKLSDVHAEHAEEMGLEKKKWVASERQIEAAAPIKQAETRKEELDKLYQSIIAKSPKAQKAMHAPAVGEEGMEAKPAAPARAPVVTPPNLPIATFNPVPPSMRPVSTVPLAEPAVVPTPAPPKTVTLVRPVPGTAAAPPSRPAGEPGRPKMEDVRAAPRLTGPVEELRAITIVDFRRLSKDPKEGALKIKDKIDLLAEQSYGRRTEGIAAWTASEVVRTYLELMRDGLNGLPLKDSAAARQAAKKPYLSPEEFQAVSDLMRQLRY